jgi:hypothetical protein
MGRKRYIASDSMYRGGNMTKIGRTIRRTSAATAATTALIE